MTLSIVRRWFNRLPPYERDNPLVLLNGVAYTPRQVLAEVERGTPTGEKLQKLIEAGRFGTQLNDAWKLAKIRLKEILKKYPEKPIVAVLPEEYTYTPSQLIKEIEQETPQGVVWIKGEIQQMARLMQLR